MKKGSADSQLTRKSRFWFENRFKESGNVPTLLLEWYRVDFFRLGQLSTLFRAESTPESILFTTLFWRFFLQWTTLLRKMGVVVEQVLVCQSGILQHKYTSLNALEMNWFIKKRVGDSQLSWKRAHWIDSSTLNSRLGTTLAVADSQDLLDLISS